MALKKLSVQTLEDYVVLNKARYNLKKNCFQYEKNIFIVIEITTSKKNNYNEFKYTR